MPKRPENSGAKRAWAQGVLWVKQCHKSPIWEWFMHVCATYQNGDDRGWFIIVLLAAKYGFKGNSIWGATNRWPLLRMRSTGQLHPQVFADV